MSIIKRNKNNNDIIEIIYKKQPGTYTIYDIRYGSVVKLQTKRLEIIICTIICILSYDERFGFDRIFIKNNIGYIYENKPYASNTSQIIEILKY